MKKYIITSVLLLILLLPYFVGKFEYYKANTVNEYLLSRENNDYSDECIEDVEWKYGGRKESLLNHDLREYRTLGYPTRVIFRKEIEYFSNTNFTPSKLNFQT